MNTWKFNAINEHLIIKLKGANNYAYHSIWVHRSITWTAVFPYAWFISFANPINLTVHTVIMTTITIHSQKQNTRHLNLWISLCSWNVQIENKLNTSTVTDSHRPTSYRFFLMTLWLLCNIMATLFWFIVNIGMILLIISHNIRIFIHYIVQTLHCKDSQNVFHSNFITHA